MKHNKESEKRTPLQRLIGEASDEVLVNAVDSMIRNQYPKVMDFRRLTPEERAVVLVLYAVAIIENGGVEYWLEGQLKGDPHSRLTAEAFKAVGLTRSYEAFQKLLRAFPDGKVPGSFGKRMSYFERLRPKARGEITRMIWQDNWDGLVSKQVAQFIRDNADKLNHLK